VEVYNIAKGHVHVTKHPHLMNKVLAVMPHPILALLKKTRMTLNLVILFVLTMNLHALEWPGILNRAMFSFAQ